jgi:hypothetical protein
MAIADRIVRSGRRRRSDSVSSSCAGAALATALLVAGCDRAAEPEIKVRYEKAGSGPALVGRSLMKRTSLLEQVAERINHTMNLSHDIELVGAQCGEANAYWNLAEKKITICYEDADLSMRSFQVAGDEDPIPAAINAEIATFYHELAHATIDMYDLPITGREEDASDQLVVFMLLEPDENGSVEPHAEAAVKDYARMFEQYAAGQEILVEADFAAKHSLNRARMYNILCWFYGHDSAEHGDLVTDGLLPEDRARGCEAEYEQLHKSWAKLLEPYLRHNDHE